MSDFFHKGVNWENETKRVRFCWRCFHFVPFIKMRIVPKIRNQVSFHKSRFSNIAVSVTLDSISASGSQSKGADFCSSIRVKNQSFWFLPRNCDSPTTLNVLTNLIDLHSPFYILSLTTSTIPYIKISTERSTLAAKKFDLRIVYCIPGIRVLIAGRFQNRLLVLIRHEIQRRFFRVCQPKSFHHFLNGQILVLQKFLVWFFWFGTFRWIFSSSIMPNNYYYFWHFFYFKP